LNFADLKATKKGIKGQKRIFIPGKAETILEKGELPWVILSQMMKLR